MEEKRVKVGVGIIILKDGKVLLGKRHNDPEKADSDLHGEGTWTMPGGKMEFGEDLEETAAREVLEETGMRVKKEDLELVSIGNDKVPDAQFITIGFLYADCKDEPMVMEPDEITEWKWFDIDTLPSKMFFPSAEMLNNYLDKVIYKRHE